MEWRSFNLVQQGNVGFIIRVNGTSLRGVKGKKDILETEDDNDN